MPHLYTRVCNICHQEFVRDHKGRKARICSDECRAIVRAQNVIKTTKRTKRVCLNCGVVFERPPCRTAKYCSEKCHHQHIPTYATGKIRSSSVVLCKYCGKSVKQFKSRNTLFCNAECYHNWDSWYKSQPDQVQRFIEQMGDLVRPSVSKVEDTVALWLDSQGIAYERQVSVVRWSIDFKIDAAFVEVQGCYWHGCPQCFILQTPKQRKVASRDKAKATYCRNRSIPLYTIWEHDVRSNNFAALIPLLDTGSPIDD